MNTLAALFHLTAMRRRAGASVFTSLRWAADLLWRNHLTAHRRRHLERRAQVEHAARQRL